MLVALLQAELALDKEKQRNTDTDAFYLGAYFRAWLFMAIALEVRGLNDAATMQSGNDWALIWFKKFRALEGQLGVDDKTLTNLLEMKYEAVEPRIRDWSAKTKLSATATKP